MLPSPGEKHRPVLRNPLRASGARGRLTAGARLAAIAIENGATLYPSEHDFQRFQGIRRVNPLA